jgi:hypothetical protein
VRIVVMRLVLTFFVLNLTFVILGILVVLLRGVLDLWRVHQTWLERLVTAIRRGPVIPLLFTFVIVIKTAAVVAILPLVVVAIVLVALPAVAIVTSVMLFCHMADLLIKQLAQFVTHLASHALLDLMLTFLCQGAISHLLPAN